jgi:hypothetical protein
LRRSYFIFSFQISRIGDIGTKLPEDLIDGFVKFRNNAVRIAANSSVGKDLAKYANACTFETILFQMLSTWLTD